MNKKEQIIYRHIEYLIDKFEDMGCPASEINHGDCMNFAENLYALLEADDIDAIILCDATFIDYSGLENEFLWDIRELCKPPENFNEAGLPCHYWILVSGKHYDSECPCGTNDIFQLPIVKKFYKK